MADKKARSKEKPVKEMMIEMKQFVSNRASIATEPTEIIKWSGTLEKHCRIYRRKKRQVQITDKGVIYWNEKDEKKTIPYTWHKDETSGENNSQRVDFDNERRNFTIHSSERKYEFTARTEGDYENIKAALGFGNSDMIISEPQNVKHHFAVQEDRKTKRLSTVGADKSVETTDDVIAELKKRGNEKVPNGLDITDRCEKNGMLNGSLFFNRSEDVTLSKEEFEKVEDANFDTSSIRSNFLFGDYEELGSDLNLRVMKQNAQMTDQDIQQLGNDEIEKLDEENNNINLVESMDLIVLIPGSTFYKERLNHTSCQIHESDSNDRSPAVGKQILESPKKTDNIQSTDPPSKTHDDREEGYKRNTLGRTMHPLKTNPPDTDSKIRSAVLENQISEPPISSTAKNSTPLNRTKDKRDRSSDSNALHSPKEISPNTGSKNRSTTVGNQISEPTISSTEFSADTGKTHDRRGESSNTNAQEKTVHSLKENISYQDSRICSAAVESHQSRLPDQGTKIYPGTVENHISEPPIPKPTKTHFSTSRDRGTNEKKEGSLRHTTQTIPSTFKKNPPDQKSKARLAAAEIGRSGPLDKNSKFNSKAVEEIRKTHESVGYRSSSHQNTFPTLKENLWDQNSRHRLEVVEIRQSDLVNQNCDIRSETDEKRISDCLITKLAERHIPTSPVRERKERNAVFLTHLQPKTSFTFKEYPPDSNAKNRSAAAEKQQSGARGYYLNASSGILVNNISEPPTPVPGENHISTSWENEKENKNEGSYCNATQTIPFTFKENPPYKECKTRLAAVEIGRSGSLDKNSKSHSKGVEEIRKTHESVGYCSSSHQNTFPTFKENLPDQNSRHRLEVVEIRQSDPVDQNCDIRSETVGNHISDCPIPKLAERHIPTSQGREMEERNAVFLTHLQPKTSFTFKDNPPDSNAKNSSVAAENQQSAARGYYLNASSGTRGSNKSQPPIPVPGENHISTSWDYGKENKNEGSYCNGAQTTPSTFKENLLDQESKTHLAAVEIQRSELPDYDSIGRSGNFGNHMSDPPLPSVAETHVSARADREQGVTNLDSNRHASTFKENLPVQNTSRRSEAVRSQMSEIDTTNNPSLAGQIGICRFGQGRQEVSDPGHQQNQRRRNVAAQHYANSQFRIGNTIRRMLFPLQHRQNRVDAGQAATVFEQRQNLEAAGRVVRVLQPRPNMLPAGRVLRVFAARPNMVNAGANHHVRIGNTINVDQDYHQPNQNQNGGSVGQIQGRVARVLEPRANGMDSVNNGSHGRM